MVKTVSENKTVPRPIAGFPEWLPQERIVEQQLLDRIRMSFERFGFSPIETPAIEEHDILVSKGEIQQQIFSVHRLGIGYTGWDLHYDLTVPLARYVAAHYRNLIFPFRRYQIQKVWRGERPQRGRSREFYQCDIDIIGDGQLDLLADAEIPCVIYEIFNDLDIGGFTILLSNRKILWGLLTEFSLSDNNIIEALLALDKIDKEGTPLIAEKLTENVGLSSEAASGVLDLVQIKGSNSEILAQLNNYPVSNPTFRNGINELTQVVDYLYMFRLPDQNFRIDLSIVRGLDYYTGTVYETRLEDFPSYGSPCSGGRFDDLASHFINKKLPGVGISIGLTRLFSTLKDANRLPIGPSSTAQVLMAVQDRELLKACLALTSHIRRQGINAEVFLDGKTLAQQLRYAQRKGIPLVVFFNAAELDNDSCQLKNLVTNVQEHITNDSLIHNIRHQLQLIAKK